MFKQLRLPWYIEHLLLATAATAFFAFFLFQSEHLKDLDIHFHITVAKLIVEEGFVARLPWMPFSIHGDRYVDFHFLIHYTMAPFVLLSPNDLVLAANLWGIVALFFSFSMLLLVLREMQARHLWFWMVVLCLSSPVFALRLLYLRGSVLFIGVICIFILLVLRRRYKLAGLLCFFGPWMYPGFPILVVFAGFFWWVELIEEKRFNHKLMIVTATGTLLGLIIHPAFPHQFYAFWLELVVHSLQPEGLQKIAEWQPVPSGNIGRTYGVPAFLLISRILLLGRPVGLEKTLLLCVFFIFFTLLGAVKPIEFFIPMLVLFLAYPFELKGTRENYALRGFAVVMTAVMIFWSVPLLSSLDRSLKEYIPVEKYFEAADWLEENTEDGEQVLVSWADFPIFFYRNRKNVYNNGLNPVYSYGKDFIRDQKINAFYRKPGHGTEFVPTQLGIRFAVLNRQHSEGSIFWLQSAPFVQSRFDHGRFVILEFPPRNR